MSQGLHLLGHKEKILEYKYKPDADQSENENIEGPAEEVQRETDPVDNDEPAAPLQPADANEGEEDRGPEVHSCPQATADVHLQFPGPANIPVPAATSCPCSRSLLATSGAFLGNGP
uniref:Uncharacterized protein n=1 Tax=Knipowitschia caucasica TaxID=637954 RepID=A0AAV2J5B5_KNICA